MDPTLTHKGAKGQPAKSDQVRQEAEADRPTVVAAEGHLETAHGPRDPSSMPINAT